MSWARLDDLMPDHPKIVGLSDRAFRVYVHSLCYCARNMTDGELPEGVLRSFGATARHAKELVDAGRWEPTGCGWLVHGYLDYNPSRAVVLERRKQRAAAGRAGGVASAASKGSNNAS